MNELLRAMDEVRALLPKAKPLVGIFCNSRVLRKLKDNCEKDTHTNYLGVLDLFFGAPICIDDRLSDDQIEAYYKIELWNSRVRAQNAFNEAKNRPF